MSDLIKRHNKASRAYHKVLDSTGDEGAADDMYSFIMGGGCLLPMLVGMLVGAIVSISLWTLL